MNNKLYKMMNWPEIEEIIYSDGDNPHRILGAHKVGSSYLIQAFYPEAKGVSVLIENTKKTYPMEMADEAGFYAAIVPYVDKLKYYFIIKDTEGKVFTYDEYKTLIEPEQTNKNGDVVMTFTYSALNYVQSSRNSRSADDTWYQTSTALYWYYKAAESLTED